MTMDPRMIAVDRIRVLPGHNARADVGDVSELAASIEANGVLQALTVVELPTEEGGPVYGLVAGERRLTAARQVGLGEVPCLVCELDERQRTVAMLVENLQRQDLDPIEEAAGIRRLVAMDLSQREIARQLGCSQSHVSKRLALLALPEQIRSAIGRPSDSGGITVADALELTRLADQPAHLAEAFDHGRHNHFGGVAGAVQSELREIERQGRVAEARSQLMAAGVKILKEERYYSWGNRPEKPLRGCGHDYDTTTLTLTVAKHRGEPCHAAAIEPDGNVVYVCREPARHSAADPKVAREQERQRQEREEARLSREAAKRRREAIATVLAAAMLCPAYWLRASV
jgi:ParB family chromosome partitioning protein